MTSTDQARAVEELAIQHAGRQLRISHSLDGGVLVDVLPGVSDRVPTDLRYRVAHDGTTNRVVLPHERLEAA